MKVSAYRGKVQLSGFVATEGQKKLADTIASQLPGVDRVENDLLLKKDGVGGSFGP